MSEATAVKDGTAQARAWRLAMAGVYVLLIVLGVRCTVSVDPFPAWSGDPLEMEAPITGITPAWSLVLDAVTLAGAAVVLWGCAMRGLCARWWEVLLLAGGGAVVAVQAYAPGRATLENLNLGSCWLAAMVAGFACWQAARDARARRVIVAVLAGLVGMMVLRAVYQVQVEHPIVYRNFLANKVQIIAAQGWSEGSPMALAYERRISQAEGSAWFGLANVFATVMAMGLTLAVGLLVSYARRDRAKGEEIGRGVVVALGLLVVGCGYGVVMAGSKGGYAAAGLGLGLIAVLGAIRKTLSARVLGVGAVMLPLLALGAVAVRGLAGGRIGELSILFRWFYLQGAVRIIAEHPVLGVGPAGFKDAYILLKPVLSPEEVSSPHSLYFDFVATLGLGGLAWCALLWRQAWAAGRAVAAAGETELGELGGARAVRDEVRPLLVVFAVVTAAGALFEHRVAMVDTTLLRAVSLVFSTALAAAVLSAMRRSEGVWVSVALSAAALVGLTHTQIELTGITAGANMYLFVVLGVTASAGVVGASGGATRWAGAVVAVVAMSVPLGSVVSVARWEKRLREAAATVEPVPYFSSRVAGLAAGRPVDGDTAAYLAKDLGKELGRSVEVSPRGISEGLTELRLERAARAKEEMVAAAWGSTDFQTTRAAQRLCLQLALAKRAGVDAGELVAKGEELMAGYMKRTRPSAPVWAWLGLSRRTSAQVTGERGWLEQAVQAYEEAAKLAPGEPGYRLELARLEAGLGRPERAAEWAREALGINENLRLDPVRQIANRELEELRKLEAGEARRTP